MKYSNKRNLGNLEVTSPRVRYLLSLDKKYSYEIAQIVREGRHSGNYKPFSKGLQKILLKINC